MFSVELPFPQQYHPLKPYCLGHPLNFPFSVIQPTQGFSIFKNQVPGLLFQYFCDFFLQSDGPSQYQEMHFMLNGKKKWGWPWGKKLLPSELTKGCRGGSL